MTPAATPPAQSEAALAAFVRDIERRGLVLAEAQCGDAQRAQAAMIASTAAFRAHVASLPLPHWPALFWQLLLAQPILRVPAVPAPRDALSQLSAGPRAALLLQLVAGLDHEQGAEVLRVSPAAYRQALDRALHALQEHGIDDAAVRDLRERLQRRAKPASVRQVAESERVAPPPRFGMLRDDVRAQRAPRWLRTLLIGLLGLLLAILIASFFWLPAFLKTGAGSSKRIETLGAQAPAAILSSTASALAGADFDLLDDPGGERIARDLDLYAWYAADTNTAAPDSTAPAPLPESTAPETSAPETEEASGAQ